MKNIFGIKKGYEIVKSMPRELMADLQVALGVQTEESVRNYINGKTELKANQVAPVKEVFKRFGVDDPFDYED